MKAYIFDLDGTLLNSMGVWTEIDVRFLKKRGIDVPPDYVDAIAALSFREAADYTISRFGLPEHPEDLMDEWNAMAVFAYGHTVPLKPGARDYLLALKARGAKLGIATSSSKQLYEPALKNHGILHLFDAICTADEVGCGKNRPEVFLLAARRLGAAPRDCIVFEDIPQAIQCAKDAGMTVYGVYDESSKAHWARIQGIAHGVLYDFINAPLPE